MTSGNGANRLLFWLLGLLAAVTLSMVGAWGMQMEARYGDADRRLRSLEQFVQEIRTLLVVQDRRQTEILDALKQHMRESK